MTLLNDSFMTLLKSHVPWYDSFNSIIGHGSLKESWKSHLKESSEPLPDITHFNMSDGCHGTWLFLGRVSNPLPAITHSYEGDRFAPCDRTLSLREVYGSWRVWFVAWLINVRRDSLMCEWLIHVTNSSSLKYYRMQLTNHIVMSHVTH